MLDRTFKVGLVLEAADGVLEIIAGALLLFLTPSTIDRIAHYILLVVFILYQLYVVVLVKFSWSLTALTFFDLFLVWLTWRE